MQNILDYLDWRGDLGFAIDPLNEVDNLIMCVLAYADWDGVVPGVNRKSVIPLLKAADRYPKTVDSSSSTDKRRSFTKDIPVLLARSSRSTRFRNTKLSNFVNHIDLNQAEQFSAVVFSIRENEHFIAFRGTDGTLAGWKEDFHMSFMDEVPAQKMAAEYAVDVISRLPGNFYFGGHSKGGNLAVYAAIRVPEEMRGRITAIYNNDGPGFQPAVIQSVGYQSMQVKIHTLVPKSSLVGMMLEHSEEYNVIASFETGIMQHNPFSWRVLGSNFRHELGLNQHSVHFSHAIREWLNQISMEQRALFVGAVFDILQSTGAETVQDFTKDRLGKTRVMVQSFKNLDSRTRKMLNKTMEAFFRENRYELHNAIGKKIDTLTATRPGKKPGPGSNP
jgi:hypothetical protein